jgi:hypothetical protein
MRRALVTTCIFSARYQRLASALLAAATMSLVSGCAFLERIGREPEPVVQTVVRTTDSSIRVYLETMSVL